MNNQYLEVTWTFHPENEESEILASYLFDIGFETFQEDENELKAYISADAFNEITFLETLSVIPVSADLTSYKIQPVSNQNWNEEWEKNFQPVVIIDRITIRASFHQIPVKTQYEIIIDPKMSFGTGHHETTAGMLEMMMKIDFSEKTVIDMGCGTAILSVFAEKLGAKLVVTIDNDPVCIENSLQNIALNDCSKIKVFLGEAAIINDYSVDIILANINRNILLNDISAYSKTLLNGGLLLMSGFYRHDFQSIDSECKKNELGCIEKIEINDWIICLYKKS